MRIYYIGRCYSVDLRLLWTLLVGAVDAGGDEEGYEAGQGGQATPGPQSRLLGTKPPQATQQERILADVVGLLAAEKAYCIVLL